MATSGAYAGSTIRFDTVKNNEQFGERLEKLVKGITFSSKESKERLLAFAEDVKAGKTIAVTDEFIKVFDDVKVANAFLDAISPLDDKGNRTNADFQSADDLKNKEKFTKGMVGYFKSEATLRKEAAEMIAGLVADKEALKAKNITLKDKNQSLIEENSRVTKSGKRKNRVIAGLAVVACVLAGFGIGMAIDNASKNDIINEKDAIIYNLEEKNKKQNEALEKLTTLLQEKGYLQDGVLIQDAVNALCNDYINATNEIGGLSILLAGKGYAVEEGKKLSDSVEMLYNDMCSATTEIAVEVLSLNQKGFISDDEIKQDGALGIGIGRMYDCIVKAEAATNKVFTELNMINPDTDKSYSVADFDSLAAAIEKIDDEVKEKLENLEGQLDNANGNLQQAQNDLEQAQKDLADAEEKIKELEGKSYDAGDFENQNEQSGDNVPVSSEGEEDLNGGSAEKLDENSGEHEI